MKRIFLHNTADTAATIQGIEDADESVRQALLSFTLHMASGDVAAATAAMRHIRGHTAWTTMARVAVRARRPDILSLCLDNIEHLPAAQVLFLSRLFQNLVLQLLPDMDVIG